MNSTGNSCYNCLDLKQITYGKTPNFENQVFPDSGKNESGHVLDEVDFVLWKTWNIKVSESKEIHLSSLII